MKPRLTSLTLALCVFAAIAPRPVCAQFTYTRINGLPVRNSPQDTDSIPISDAAGTTWRIPYSLLSGTGGGSGNVTGAGSSFDGDIALFSGTTGKILKDSNAAAGGVQAIKITGAAGAGFLDLAGQNATPATPGGGTRLFAGTASNASILWEGTSGYVRALVSTLTANRTWALQDADGTLLLDTNIGVTVQAYDADLATIAGQSNTTFGLGLLTQANAAAGRNTLGASSGIWPVAQGGTGTASPGIVAGVGVGVSGSWPNQTISANPPASEQQIANANTGWSAGNSVLRQTAALSGNFSSALPAANSSVAGTIVTYIDAVTATTSNYARTFTPSGSDSINGSTDPAGATPFYGAGSVDFETDGSGNWTVRYHNAILVSIQDGSDHSKTGNWDLSGLTTGTNSQEVFPNLTIWHPAVLENSNTFTGTKQTFVHIGGTAGIAITVGSGSGTGGTAAIDGTDLGGLITIATGTSTGVGALATIVYGVAHTTNTPHIALTAHNAAAITALLASGHAPLPTSETLTGFTLSSGSSALTASTTYEYVYQILR
jgi:hypothetical protein